VTRLADGADQPVRPELGPAEPTVRPPGAAGTDSTQPAGEPVGEPAVEGGGSTPDSGSRAGLGAEVLLVLGVSVGASAVFAALYLVGTLTGPVALSDSQATLNRSYAPARPLLDLALQLASIGFGVVPALLALHLLRRAGRSGAVAIGLDTRRPRWDLGWGALLAAAIGIPGLLLYLAAHALGISATVVAAALPSVWWRIPVLVLAAVGNALLEEVVVVGYLLTRFGQMGWRPGRALVVSALLRGSYHLYQGFGALLGNAVMGLVFGRFYQRTGRVMPLVIAHAVLDVVAFVGYALLHGRVGWLP
jgi:uncharacterized protein